MRERLKDLPDESVHCVVTSPPYFGLRDYGVAGQIGLEPTPAEFVQTMVDVFREVRRVLRADGTLWLNLGDSYCNTDKWGGGGNVGKNTVAADGSVPSWAVRRKRPHMPGLKPKDLIGIPWRVAFALQDDGWWLRSSIIWHKPNPMPESVTDRPTSAHENIFLLAKSERYYYDHASVKEARASDEDANGFRGGAYVGGNIDNNATGKRTAVGNKRVMRSRETESSARPPASRPHKGLSAFEAENGRQYGSRNLRNVWTVATQPFSEAHFATFPPSLIEPCIKAGCPAGGTVLDPFGGAGTTGLVADRLGRNAVLIELNPDYAAMARRRIEGDAGMFAGVALESAE